MEFTEPLSTAGVATRLGTLSLGTGPKEPHERQQSFGTAGCGGSKPSRGSQPRGRNVPGEANPG